MVIQKCEKLKKWIFGKNCLSLFVSGREKKRAFSCTLSVLAKMFFWTKTVQSRKHYKKNDTIFGKRCFLTWLKKWVLLNVFVKSCVSWKHYSYSVFNKAQLFKNKNCMLKKNRTFMNNSGLFLNMAKWCFLGLVFWGLILKGFVFAVSGIVSKVLKMLVFPNFGGFSGVAHCCSSGFGRFRCFCVSCVCFSFLCCFCSVFFALLLVLWLDVVVLFFWWFFFCCFLFFFEGLRVRWGGPKGHLTWP